MSGSGRAAGVEAPNVLQRILASTRAEVERRKREQPRFAGPLPVARPGRLANALSAPGMGVIAEFKRRSPSAGEIRPGAVLEEMVGCYARGGASALSVLTDAPSFGGSLDDLRAARTVADLPILRKDFVVDPYQLLEARAAGADAVLLIVAALDDADLAALYAEAGQLGLDVLVEVHDRDELARALALRPRIVGVNNRDLRDFTVDVTRTLRLAAEVPADVLLVSESGIARHEQLAPLSEAGVAAVLVGEALMRAGDPEQALRELRAGRS